MNSQKIVDFMIIIQENPCQVKCIIDRFETQLRLAQHNNYGTTIEDETHFHMPQGRVLLSNFWFIGAQNNGCHLNTHPDLGLSPIYLFNAVRYFNHSIPLYILLPICPGKAIFSHLYLRGLECWNFSDTINVLPSNNE